MFGLFKKKAGASGLQPESKWLLSINGQMITVTDAKGQVSSISDADLTGIAIETNDSGPWGIDFWWLLFGPEDKLACAFPQGATGESEIFGYLKGLSDVDYDHMKKAMSSTQNAVFAVWRKPA